MNSSAPQARRRPAARYRPTAIPSCATIDRAQRAALLRGSVPEGGAGLMRHVADNHRCNMLLWEQEDLARRHDAPDAEIVGNKRAIDRYNQARNDAVEAIDEALLAAIAVAPRPDAWINSETAGSIIDRLSINSLKLHHMGLEAQRDDAGDAHRARCRSRLQRLAQQRRDLLGCLDALLRGMHDGRCTYRIYRQFKMYNDPALNPYLRRAACADRAQHG